MPQQKELLADLSKLNFKGINFKLMPFVKAKFLTPTQMEEEGEEEEVGNDGNDNNNPNN